MKQTYLFLCSLLIVLSTSILQASQKTNPYGLLIIDNLALYQAVVEKNPELELVNLKKYLPDAIFDIRYADINNFTGEIIYTRPGAWARKKLAEALQKVQKSLDSMDLTLIIYDAYRPYSATQRFYEVYPDTSFVAAPWLGSRHNRGAAVDVSIANKYTRKELYMPSMFDDFSAAASPTNMSLPKEAVKNRELLINIMGRYGFNVYPTEWWHYDFQNWEHYDLMDLSFEELETIKK